MHSNVQTKHLCSVDGVFPFGRHFTIDIGTKIHTSMNLFCNKYRIEIFPVPISCFIIIDIFIFINIRNIIKIDVKKCKSHKKIAVKNNGKFMKLLNTTQIHNCV